MAAPRPPKPELEQPEQPEIKAAGVWVISQALFSTAGGTRSHVQDVSKVNVVVNALKHVNLEQCMKQLEFQYGIDKLKLFY